MRWEGPYWLVCAGFALLLAATTTLTSHRVWGVCAAAAYAGAALLAGREPRPWARNSAIAAVTGAVLVPLALLMVLGTAQSEVGVVERSADLLLNTGTPYAAHPVGVGDFNPYLPGMAVFGLPHALLGDTPFADARLWFAAVFLLSMTLAARYVTNVPEVARGSARRLVPRVNSALLLTSCPAVALPLVVGGVDLPVVGLMCLGLALAGRVGRSTASGEVMGAAAALKWTAWPLLAVGLALIAVTSGRRAAIRAAATALLVSAVAVVPSVVADPHAFVEHVVLFPLGAAGTGSPATSPLPGYLLAHNVPGGRAIAVGALTVSVVALAASLFIRPPRTVTAAADRLALGLALAMCLMPATRFGYLVYPLVLVAWFHQERERTRHPFRTHR
ncbi:glycosyltransferase 87 family protein [Streptomyces sp. NPDC088350]|uniref:glycosyltransferase 87 family protein n=1 Tax=Streptomyces sp. NPDC088350 TaxID=3365854 RepID=UPI003816DD2F